MQSNTRLRSVHAPLHPELRVALLDALDARRPESRPPVLVVPSAALGRDLVRSHALGAGATWNVRTLGWLELATGLTARERGLERRRLLGAEARAWLLQRLQGKRGRAATCFDPVLGVRGFRIVLGRCFEELARAGLATGEDVERLLVLHGFEMPLQARHALELYLAYRQSFESTHDDASSLLARAATVPAGRCAATIGHRVWIFGFPELSGVERRLLAHLSRDSGLELRVFVPRAEPTSTDLVEWLDARGFELESPPSRTAARRSAATRMISAPSAESEADEIARQLLAAAADGMPYGSMAVVVRGPQRLDLLRAVLRRRGIPCTFHPGPSLRTSRCGRALLFLLDLLDAPFEPAPVLSLLAVAPLRAREWAGADGEATPSGWERVAREAFVGRGAEDWQTKLGRYRDEQQSAAERAEQEGDPAQRARGSARAAEDLSRVAGALDRELRGFPARGRWSEFVEATAAWLDRVFESSPEIEPLRAALERLRPLDGLGGGAPSRNEFRDAVRDLLAEAVHDAETMSADAVRVGTASGFLGLEFDLICIAGIQEGEWPGRPQHDPVLRERERAALAPLLPDDVRLGSAEDQVERDRWLFRTACTSARRCLVLSYARLDPVNGAECLPSPLVLEFADRREGRAVDYATLEKLDWVERVPLRRIRIPDHLPKLGLDEFDTSTVLGLRPGAARAYVRGLGEGARRGWLLDHLRNHVARFTSADGVLAGRAARAALAARFSSPSFSATQLAHYATCPFRYFLRHLLRVEPLDRDEHRELSGPEVGRLVHHILERFYAALDADGRALEEVGDTELAARLHAVEALLFREMEEQGRTGARLLWSIRKQRLAEDLRRFLREERARGTGRFRPVAFEARFGRNTDLRAWVRTPDHETIALHGSIDRLDESPEDGAMRVIDYKSGRLLSGGRDPGATQLAVYLWAATGGEPRILDRSEGRLVSVTRRGGFAVRRLTGATLRQRSSDLSHLVGGVTTAIRAGSFFPMPGPDAAHCRVCDYAGLCEARVAEQSARKAAAATAQVRAFAELPDFSDSLETLLAGEDLAPEEAGEGES